MISIGIHLKGPELSKSPIDQALTAALNVAIDARGEFRVGEEPAVNVVFLVPGSLGSADFDYLREGKFSAKDKLLLVEVPIPQKAMNSESITAFIIDALHGANAVAFDFFRRRGKEQFALEKAEAIVKQIQSALALRSPDRA